MSATTVREQPKQAAADYKLNFLDGKPYVPLSELCCIGCHRPLNGVVAYHWEETAASISEIFYAHFAHQGCLRQAFASSDSICPYVHEGRRCKIEQDKMQYLDTNQANQVALTASTPSRRRRFSTEHIPPSMRDDTPLTKRGQMNSVRKTQRYWLYAKIAFFVVGVSGTFAVGRDSNRW